jgi:hypothetical protein
VQIRLGLGQFDRYAVPIHHHAHLIGVSGDVGFKLLLADGGGPLPIGTASPTIRR